MKHRNLILFIVLLCFVGITYWFEERGTIEKKKEDNLKYSVLDVKDFGEMKGFQGIKLNFFKKGNVFFAAENNLELSPKKVDEFFLILAGLKTMSAVPNQDVLKVGKSFYIPDETMKMSFKFEKGNLEFVLGKKLDYDQAFYMEIVKNGVHQIFVVNDESPDPGVYANEKEFNKSNAKYKRLEMMFLLTNVYFYETKVFNHQNYSDQIINFKKIDISTFRNKKFQIDFEKTVTTPPVLKGLIYDEDNWIAFHKVLTNLEGKTIYYPVKESNLDEVLSHFEVTDRSGTNYTIDVYKKYGSLIGYFLKTSLNKDKLFELKNEDAMYFFVNVQDFWKKQLTPTSKHYQLKLKFPLDKNQEVTMQINDAEMFDAISQNKALRILEVKKLIDFLKLSADHASEVNTLHNNAAEDTVLDLYFENRHLGVMLDDNDVIIKDFDNNIKLHHYVGKTVPFHYRWQEFFEKK